MKGVFDYFFYFVCPVSAKIVNKSCDMMNFPKKKWSKYFAWQKLRSTIEIYHLYISFNIKTSFEYIDTRAFSVLYVIYLLIVGDKHFVYIKKTQTSTQLMFLHLHWDQFYGWADMKNKICLRDIFFHKTSNCKIFMILLFLMGGMCFYTLC